MQPIATNQLKGIEQQTFDMELEEVAHLAGVVDGAGSISVHITKEASYPVGYRYRPIVTVTRPEWDEAMLGKLDAYAEEQGIQYSIEEKGTSIVFRITSAESIKRFLEPISPYLVTRYRDAQIMVEQIVPALEGDNHQEKEIFYELVGLADQIRRKGGRGSNSKYTQEYFEEEWDLASA